MERIDWKKPKWDRVTTQRQKRNLAKLLSNQTSRVLLVYLVFFTLVTLVEKSSQSVNRSDVAKSKSFQFSPIPKTRHEMERRNLDATCVSYLSKNRRKRHQQKKWKSRLWSFVVSGRKENVSLNSKDFLKMLLRDMTTSKWNFTYSELCENWLFK